MSAEPHSNPRFGSVSQAQRESDSHHFVRARLQHLKNLAPYEYKKALKILAFLFTRRACTMVLLRIIKNCSIIAPIQAGIFWKVEDPGTLDHQDAFDRAAPALGLKRTAWQTQI